MKYTLFVVFFVKGGAVLRRKIADSNSREELEDLDRELGTPLRLNNDVTAINIQIIWNR